MSKHSPFRAQFTKAPIDVQIRILTKVKTGFESLPQLVNELTRVNPVISVCRDGRASLLTDKHLFV